MILVSWSPVALFCSVAHKLLAPAAESALDKATDPQALGRKFDSPLRPLCLTKLPPSVFVSPALSTQQTSFPGRAAQMTVACTARPGAGLLRFGTFLALTKKRSTQLRSICRQRWARSNPKLGYEDRKLQKRPEDSSTVLPIVLHALL